MYITNEVMENSRLTLSFNVAKTENQGEDADPVFYQKDNLYFLSVSDGMGGAGSTTYEIDGVQKSGAFLSSRLVNQQAEAFFSDLVNKGEIFNENNLGDLRTALLNPLQQKISEVKKNGGSKLKSKLLKDLPTTFSGLFINKNENNIDVCSIWAGDSRNYLFAEVDGLQQLSADDLKQKYDPLENLSKDSPLNNVVSADGDFTIRFNKISTTPPCILFSATDGCYGYFNTPMQFEYAMLQTMFNSDNIEEWKQKLINEIGSVAGDDYSISLVTIGYNSFQEIKGHFNKRMHDVYRHYVTDLEKQDEMMKNLFEEKKIIEKDIKKVDFERIESQKQIWEDYKKQYLKYINS